MPLDVCATCVFIFDEEIICKGEGIRVSNCRSERDASTLVAYKVENGADSVVDARRNRRNGQNAGGLVVYGDSVRELRPIGCRHDGVSEHYEFRLVQPPFKGLGKGRFPPG